MRQQLWLSFLLILLVGAASQGQTCSTQSYLVSPEAGDGAQSMILQTVQGSRISLDIALSSFTDSQLGDAIIRASRRGVSVRVILATAAQTEVGGQYAKLVAAKVQVELAPAAGLFSHHFAVIDGATLITGSYNWSDPTSHKTYGSLTVVQCPSSTVAHSTTGDFAGEFDRLWEVLRGEQAAVGTSGTSSPLVLVTIPDVDRVEQCVELLNSSGGVVNIAGWAIGDFEGRYVFPEDTELAPGEPFRVCIDTFNPMHDTLGLYLDPTHDEIFLVTPEGTIVDEVVW